MKVVINIDDNLYTRLFDNGKIDATDMLKSCTAIRKGKVLPKGHERKFEKIIVEYPTCRYHYYDKEEESWVCDNPDSELFTDYTEYQDTCEEWEERE